MASEVAPARAAAEGSEDWLGPPGTAHAATWRWDLASGRVEWDDRLKALFGYAVRVTDAAWREGRIHPEDRARVKVSLERATLVNHGAVWSEEYRFRRADGLYVTVVDRASVVSDGAGPRAVIGPTPGPGRRRCRLPP